MNKFIIKNYKDNILHRIANVLDSEIDQYTIDILRGLKKIDNLDSKILRRQIFEENKEQITNEMIDILKEEIEELRNENRQLYKKNTFELSDSQQKEIEKWDKEHKCNLEYKYGSKYVGAIGGHLSYTFTPTSIGIFVKVKCSCGEILKINDL